MRRVNAWVTSDGQVFTDRHKAARHAEERYGAVLTALAHEAVRIEKYAAMGDFIEANLSRFIDLAALGADRVEEDSADD